MKLVDAVELVHWISSLVSICSNPQRYTRLAFGGQLLGVHF